MGGYTEPPPRYETIHLRWSYLKGSYGLSDSDFKSCSVCLHPVLCLFLIQNQSTVRFFLTSC